MRNNSHRACLVTAGIDGSRPRHGLFRSSAVRPGRAVSHRLADTRRASRTSIYVLSFAAI